MCYRAGRFFSVCARKSKLAYFTNDEGGLTSAVQDFGTHLVFLLIEEMKPYTLYVSGKSTSLLVGSKLNGN
jgi:hypothetical protein